MNNLVEITYKTNDRYPVVTINGEEITRFTALSGYIYDDIFRWANVFFELIDGDIAEGYRVSLIGHPYQAAILRAAATKSEFCEGVDFQDYAGAISLADKYTFASRLQANAGVPQASLTFRTANPQQFAHLAGAEIALSTDGDSPYCIAASEEEAEALNGKYCIVLSDKTEVAKKPNNCYWFFVRQSDLAMAVDYFLCYHLRLIVISDVLSNVAKYADNPKSALAFEAYTQEAYRVWAERLPDQMDEGVMTPWSFEVFPACFVATDIVVTSSNPAVVDYGNGMVIAKGQGEATLRITDKSGQEYFSQTISVTHHNYATNITIVLPATTLLVGETMRFRTIITPINAEDADQVRYSVSDERVAVLTSTDELYGLSAGRVCLTISTPRVSAKVYVTVPAQVCDVLLSTENELTLPFSTEATIFGTPFPPNAVPLPNLVWSVDKGGTNVVSIVRSNNQQCVLRSRNPGRAVLTCRLSDTTIEKKVVVTVPKRKGCYIATAVYGSYDCPEVWALRRYRDEYLDTRALGRLFIRCYYAVSPTVVKCCGNSRLFNAFWQRVLDRKIAKLKQKGYDCTPYTDKNY